MDCRVPFSPHAGQVEILDSPARFRDVCCGRRWGKTRLAGAEAFREMVSGNDRRVWIVAPTFKVADEDWSMPGGLCDLVRQTEDLNGIKLVAELNKSDRRMVTVNGSIAEVRTAEREDNLRGGGLNLLILDEAGQIGESAWNTLRPTISDRLGRALRLGTPKGRNWWYREFVKGQGNDPERQSWQRPSSSNPHFPAKEMDAARESLPLDWFQQEYQAEFLQAMAAVFKKLDDRLVAGGATPPAMRGRYVHGLDLAQKQDWTVLCTVDLATRKVVNILRMQRIPYTEQAQRLRPVVAQYPGTVWADETGVGTPVIEGLRVGGMDVKGFTFTADSKAQLVGNLMLSIETAGGILIPTDGPEFKTLIQELRDFEYQTTPAGRVTYNAPSGCHDDCVMALALALWGIQKGGASFQYEPSFKLPRAS